MTPATTCALVFGLLFGTIFGSVASLGSVIILARRLGR